MQTSSFQLTRWSMVRGAVTSDPAVREAALERLRAALLIFAAPFSIPIYWYARPLPSTGSRSGA